jgi:hypothetical protein
MELVLLVIVLHEVGARHNFQLVVQGDPLPQIHTSQVKEAECITQGAAVVVDFTWDNASLGVQDVFIVASLGILREIAPSYFMEILPHQVLLHLRVRVVYLVVDRELLRLPEIVLVGRSLVQQAVVEVSREVSQIDLGLRREYFL